ncbi:MAG TPA: histidine kinase dimerization/phospho-acceptor domain-containing protein [Terracidiphilus sp.]|nr:histidine kinase dimerization/phospho-acceptor domain-containing protein [Terracidiphilus sp.]
MPESYQLPALLLTALLLPVFAQLYARSRAPRTLLWLLGFLFACVRMVQELQIGWWNFTNPAVHPWAVAAGETAAIIGATLFLASLSPLTFSVGKYRVLYAVPFVLPLALYAILLDGVYRGTTPTNVAFLLFPSLGAIALLVGCFWALAPGSMPTWLGLSLCIAMGGASLWICVAVRGNWPLVFVANALHFCAALLVYYVYRRLSPGTLLSGIGFLAWSTRIVMVAPFVQAHAELNTAIAGIHTLGCVVAALGMIVLALEDQLATEQTAQDRERNARRELEAYTNVVLSRRRVEDFDRQASLICQTVTNNSRFTQAALLLTQGGGQYRLAGTAGIDDAAVNALEALATRIPAGGFLAPGANPLAAEHSQSYKLSLAPWLLPGDDLERLHLTEFVAVPLHGRASTEGALLVAGLRNPDDAPRADELLPLEVLAARIQSARSQTMMLEKLIDAEKFAGLGQLANNVTRQLNNPLTVILGYASLLEVTPDMNPKERKAIESILNEARSMRATLESLSRMSRTQTEHLSAISVTELLNDMEQLHRSEFVHRAIDFRLHVEPALPRALGNAQQVRQAVLYCLQFAIEAVESSDAPSEKSVRIDATAESDSVKILIAHTGPGFLHPARAFDPFVPAQAAGETAGLGLSLCATILRENNGRISALNFKPRGAGIVLELQAA